MQICKPVQLFSDDSIPVSAYVNVFIHFHNITYRYFDMSIDSCSRSVHPLPEIEV